MSMHDRFAGRRSVLSVGAVLLALGACTGGKDFTTATPFDGGGSGTNDANDAFDASVGNIILNPNDNGSVDGTVQSCAASELQCDGGCTANDTNNCGGCGVECQAPEAGTATCSLSGSQYACGIACNANHSQCGNSCVDLRSDTNNCGRCGHGCLGAACDSGLCQSWVVADEQIGNALLFPPRAGLFAHAELVTDGKNVVWMDSQAGVLETSATGGPSSPIINIAPMSITSSLGFGDLAIVNGLVIWTMWDSNSGISVWKASATGKSTDANTGMMVATLGVTTAGDLPSGIAVDETAANIYFVDSLTMTSGTAPSSPGLFTCVMANQSCTKLMVVAPTMQASADDVAAADGRIFFSDSGQWTVNQYLGSHQMTAGPAMGLAVDSTYVYWLENIQGDAANNFDVHRAPMSNFGATSQLVVPTQNGQCYAMATDGTNLYFSNTGALEYMPASGVGAPQVLTDSQRAFAIAAGGGAIYWLNGDNTIDGIAAP